MMQSKDDFYEELGREMNKKFTAILEQNIQPLLDKDIEPAAWCRDIAFKHSISQDISSAYLKRKYDLDVDLLPEPELTITINY